MIIFAATQVIKVSKIVVDKSGEPIIWASVIIKSTKKGVATDLDSKFTLTDIYRFGQRSEY